MALTAKKLRELYAEEGLDALGEPFKETITAYQTVLTSSIDVAKDIQDKVQEREMARAERSHTDTFAKSHTRGALLLKKLTHLRDHPDTCDTAHGIAFTVSDNQYSNKKKQKRLRVFFPISFEECKAFVELKARADEIMKDTSPKVGDTQFRGKGIRLHVDEEYEPSESENEEEESDVESEDEAAEKSSTKNKKKKKSPPITCRNVNLSSVPEELRNEIYQFFDDYILSWVANHCGSDEENIENAKKVQSDIAAQIGTYGATSYRNLIRPNISDKDEKAEEKLQKFEEKVKLEKKMLCYWLCKYKNSKAVISDIAHHINGAADEKVHMSNVKESIKKVDGVILEAEKMKDIVDKNAVQMLTDHAKNQVEYAKFAIEDIKKAQTQSPQRPTPPVTRQRGKLIAQKGQADDDQTDATPPTSPKKRPASTSSSASSRKRLRSSNTFDKDTPIEEIATQLVE